MKKNIIVTILFIYSFISISFGQDSKNELLNNLIFKFMDHHVTKEEIHNELGIPKDTLKNTIYDLTIPTYPKLGLSFVSFYKGKYNAFIIDVDKFNAKFSSKYFKITPKTSFSEFIIENSMPKNITIVKRNIGKRDYYNRIIMIYDNYEILSEPQTEIAINLFEKRNLTDIKLLKKNTDLLKKIRVNYIWCNFEGQNWPPEAD